MNQVIIFISAILIMLVLRDMGHHKEGIIILALIWIVDSWINKFVERKK